MESEHNVMRAIALYSCIAGLILASECSVFFLVKIIAAIFDFTAAEGWREEEICTKGVSDRQEEEKGRGGKKNFCPFPASFTHCPL